MWVIIATWCMAYDGINKASEMLKNKDDAGNGTYDRSRKDSFYWYQKCIATNGEDLN